MTTSAAFFILIGILSCYQERVSCQSTEAYFYDIDGMYMVCEAFTTEPMMCSSVQPESFLFSTNIGTNLDISVHMCDGVLYGYYLFDTNEIYRLELPLPSTGGTSISILDTAAGISGIISFEICCERIFFATANEVYVQNLDDSDGLHITSLLYKVSGVITHIDVCCYNDNYNIFHTIDDDGLYITSMDGRITNRIIDYESSATIEDLDVNCGIDHLAFGVGDSLYVFDISDIDLAADPVLLSSMSAWETRNGETVSALSLAAAESDSAPNVMTAWSGESGDGYALTFTTASGSSSVITPGTSFARQFVNIFVCLNAQDCSLGCPSSNTCPCDVDDFFQNCCAGLCVQTNGDPGHDSDCFCSDDRTFYEDGCTTTADLPTAATDCPLDLIAAVKCHRSTRTTSSSIYALSLYSLTSICATDVKGKKQSLPLGTFPFQTHTIHTSEYLFQGPTNLKDYHGNRYGLYSAQTRVSAIGESGEQVDSFPVIVQEGIDALYVEYITISTNVGTEITLRLRVTHHINTHRIRWQKNGKFLKKYNGKVTITFDSVTSSNEGIFEIYFQGRIKRGWRQIIRVIVRSDSCGGYCVANGGVCSYSGSYCVCSPGRVGLMCEDVCVKGNFGLRGVCGFSCQEEFGDDSSDCQNVLFCLEDPHGCQCYPGYEQPNCSACDAGFFGLNCQEECTCTTGQQCDSYDGTCT